MKPRWVYSKQLSGYRVTVYGTNRNWNFTGMNAKEVDASNNGVLAALNHVMEELGIKCAFAPRPVFNALVVPSKYLTVELFPNFFRGVNADGVILTEPGDAYFLASADCLTAAVFNPKTHQLAGLHCGRDALVDRKRLAGGNPRPHRSVIEAGIRLLEKDLFDSVNFTAFLAAGIGPETFIHPTTKIVRGVDGVDRLNMNWATNKQLVDHLSELDAKQGGCRIVIDSLLGKISLVDLARLELSRRAVPSANVQWDGYDTATDKANDGTFLFHSNRRKSFWRNLVVVQLE